MELWFKEGGHDGQRENKQDSSAAGANDYVFRTCDQNFPTFQALSDHQASHKKTKSPAPLALWNCGEIQGQQVQEPAEKKKASEGTQPFSFSFKCKTNDISTDQSSFESCAVAYAMFTKATLPKDQEATNIMVLSSSVIGRKKAEQEKERNKYKNNLDVVNKDLTNAQTINSSRLADISNLKAKLVEMEKAKEVLKLAG
ncbi:hypothetical protein LguiA_002708 [Lonicera macranthoides]